MTRFPTFFSLLILLLLNLACTQKDENHKLRLWYSQPASEWNEALPVGNGRLGAMVFGRFDSERLQLNEESLWAGTQIDNNNPTAKEHLVRIQELLLEEKNTRALELAKKHLLGTPPRIRSYQTLGDLYIDFPYDSTEVKNYRRELDLPNGISTTSYKVNGINYQQTVFASSPDNVIVVHYFADKPGQIRAAIRLNRERDASVTAVSDSVLLMEGQIVDEEDPERGPAGKHTRFAAKVLARTNSGSIESQQDQLAIRDADEFTLILTAATDYNREKLNFDRSIQPVSICDRILHLAEDKTTENLKQGHIKSHRAYFDRVSIDLGSSPVNNLPTDERLQRVKDGEEDPDLVELYFQYGRYLLMGSSRPPARLPANLQGIWNPHFEAPWNSDFHTNINLQMNYWPADLCNLPETVIPLTDFFMEIIEPGKVTAQKMYDADGWTMHHSTDIFGRTALADGIQWGTSPLAGAWMTLTFWRHYEFTLDKTYLKDKAYPMMKGAAKFILDFLVSDGQGHLVTAPSMSPENAFILNGEEHQLTYGATIDIQIIKELFTACIKAGTLLNDAPAFLNQLRTAMQKLPPVKIGENGTIMEWIKDYEEAEPGHRHISHLFGLHPGTQITPKTPKLFNAAQKTIERRLAHGGGHTGWSRAWIVNFYARLREGDSAHVHLQKLLQKSTLPNLFDTHPPFQIDGNFGGTSGIAEMLVQSHMDGIDLLPALPKAWLSGYVRGLKARGDFTVNIRWENGELKRASVTAHKDGPCKIRYQHNVVRFPAEAGLTYHVDKSMNLYKPEEL